MQIFESENAFQGARRNERARGPSSKHGAKSLIETLVSLTLGFLLLALLSVGAVHARNASRNTFCLSNLHQIHQALMLYRVEFNAFPLLSETSGLRDVLKPWLPTESTYHCPEDEVIAADSYSYFYAPRSPWVESESYLIGCPRHQKFSRGVAVNLQSSATVSPVATILHDGESTVPGSEYNYGEFRFADGSSATIANGQSTQESNDTTTYSGHGNSANTSTLSRNGNPGHLSENSGIVDDSETGAEMPTLSTLYSIKREDGTHYTIVKMKEGTKGTVYFNIVPGNRFEVVTPSAIIAVRGTQFSVENLRINGKSATQVVITSGVIDMEPVGKGQGIRLTPTPGDDRGFALKGDAPIHN